jgi:hypothetical protein
MNIGTLSTSHPPPSWSVVATALINNELSDHDPDRETAAATAAASIPLVVGKPLAAGKAILG